MELPRSRQAARGAPGSGSGIIQFRTAGENSGREVSARDQNLPFGRSSAM